MASRIARFNWIMAITVFPFLISCDKGDDLTIEDGDYLVFGHFYGECLGEECVEIFLLTDTKLYEDSNDQYGATEDFNFHELGSDTFEQVKDLIDYFPVSLLDDDEEVYGCPDCGDWGGLNIQYSKDGIVKSWRIDQMKENVPDYLYEFIDKVNEKIALIND